MVRLTPVTPHQRNNDMSGAVAFGSTRYLMCSLQVLLFLKFSLVAAEARMLTEMRFRTFLILSASADGYVGESGEEGR